VVPRRPRQPAVSLPWSKEDPDGDWRVPADATVDGMLRAYRAECARSDMAIARHELKETVPTTAAASAPDGSSPT
jgi:hypothetical protein